jgi:hypothetical protein
MPIREKIREINRTHVTPSAREQALMDLLRTQTILLGLVISQSSGKGIGAIDHGGLIRHCDPNDAWGPYRIIIKPSSKDRIPYSGTGAVKFARAIGQCVDNQGKTIAEIVRQNKQNRLALASKSSAPVIAMVLPSESPQSPLKAPRADNSNELDRLISESKALIEAANRKI